MRSEPAYSADGRSGVAWLIHAMLCHSGGGYVRPCDIGPLTIGGLKGVSRVGVEGTGGRNQVLWVTEALKVVHPRQWSVDRPFPICGDSGAEHVVLRVHAGARMVKAIRPG